MSDQQQELRLALEELTTACEADFESRDTSVFGDDESVGGGMDGDCAVTFGMIRRARALLSAGAVPQQEPHGWQPIETAPKDGSEIRVRGRSWEAVGSWHVDRWYTHSAYGDTRRPLVDGKRSEAPTHWKPLSAGAVPTVSRTEEDNSVVLAAEDYAALCVTASGRKFEIGELVNLKAWFYAGARWRDQHPDAEVLGPQSDTMVVPSVSQQEQEE